MCHCLFWIRNATCNYCYWNSECSNGLELNRTCHNGTHVGGDGTEQDAPQKGLGKGMKGDSKGSRESAHKGSKSGFQDVEA
eukprot:3520196-Amphidinium_carterae.1